VWHENTALLSHIHFFGATPKVCHTPHYLLFATCDQIAAERRFCVYGGIDIGEVGVGLYVYGTRRRYTIKI
jgi:hypothetical protein